MPSLKLELPPMPPPEDAVPESAPRAGARLPPDVPGRRLGWGLLISIPVNAILWLTAADTVRRHVLAPAAPIEITRILLPTVKPPRKAVHKKIIHKTPPKPKRIVMPKWIARHIPLIRPRRIAKPKPRLKPRLVIKPRPIVKPVVKPHVVIRPRTISKPKAVSAPAHPAAHHHVLTARSPSSQNREFTVPQGGHATLGKPIEHQSSDSGDHSDQKPETRPEGRPEAKPETRPETKPVPPADAEPSGPTQDAEPSNQIKPEIPDELKQESFKTFVRVKVDIEADGGFSVTLRTSSGNSEIDRRVIEALQRWKWKPALRDGRPIRSTQRFRFEFEVE
ncbi:MAG: TonB family protein [Armatimonadetes bacterium]|nr:TonB family protein [Armatimonadota bacterium]